MVKKFWQATASKRIVSEVGVRHGQNAFDDLLFTTLGGRVSPAASEPLQRRLNIFTRPTSEAGVRCGCSRAIVRHGTSHFH